MPLVERYALSPRLLQTPEKKQCNCGESSLLIPWIIGSANQAGLRCAVGCVSPRAISASRPVGDGRQQKLAIDISDPGVDYVALVSPAYIGQSGYGTILSPTPDPEDQPTVSSRRSTVLIGDIRVIRGSEVFWIFPRNLAPDFTHYLI